MKSISTVLCLLASAAPGLTQFSQTNLGTAATFGALAPKSITSTGNTAVTGSVGVESVNLIGFPPATSTGGSQQRTTAVITAVTDANTARTAALALTPTSTITALAVNSTLTPGVYKFQRAAIISGNLTLDGDGTFVFQGPSSLQVQTGTNVILQGGALAENVFWAVDSTVVFANGVDFKGTVMAASTVGIGAGTAINGGVYAGNSITLDDNKVGLVASS